MWNPIIHMSDAWKAESTIWGRLAVILFYVYIWGGVVSGLISVILPTSQGGGCYVAHMHDNAMKDLVLSMMRVENLVFVFFFLFLEMHKTHICNVTILTGVMLASYFVSRKPLMAVDDECFHNIRISFILFGWTPLLIWVLVMIEYMQGRGRHVTAGETQPLVT